MQRVVGSVVASVVAILVVSVPAAACGGLIGPRGGAVSLLRTTTLASYHDGVEHYVTSFEFAGGGAEFGSIVPLPGVPSDVQKGGDWTLQRLLLETDPLPLAAIRRDGELEEAGSVDVLLETTIDALDLTVLKGGGADVAAWARERGFELSDDADEVLDYYAQRSPIFLAAAFDSTAAAERGQLVGDGTPVHVTIPTPDPWVPLRILGMGKPPSEVVEADVYLLTDRRPAMLPAIRPVSAGGFRGLSLEHSAPASEPLLDDLRSDRGMEWVPESAWLTKVSVQSSAADLRFDLAVDASGQGTPSRIAAGLPVAGDTESAIGILLPLMAILVAGGSAAAVTRRIGRRP